MNIPEDDSKLITLDWFNNEDSLNSIVACLKDDSVVLLQNIDESKIDEIIESVANSFGLQDNLALQAAFASSLNHRENISEYYMSVNKRQDYHFVPPHSEGSSFAHIQLASFYCYENSTDGGETILMNINDNFDWTALKEFVIRAKPQGKPTQAQVARARAMYRLDLHKDNLRESDYILNEIAVSPDLTLYEVYAEPEMSFSKILAQERYVYWDSICSVDHDVIDFMKNLLRDEGVFKFPVQDELSEHCGTEKLDWDPGRRNLKTGINYQDLFNCKITRKLNPGDLIIQNNFTWTHAVNNWSPGSGVRKVAAAFA